MEILSESGEKMVADFAMLEEKLQQMQKEVIDHNFKYHAPSENDIKKHQAIREILKETAYKLVDLMPQSMEAHQAIVCLEEVMMWANAAVARHSNT